jgi:hypothetical protein
VPDSTHERCKSFNRLEGRASVCAVGSRFQRGIRDLHQKRSGPRLLEHACQPFIDTLLNAPNLSPWENELIARKIQEIRDAPEAFKAAVQCSMRRNELGSSTAGCGRIESQKIVPLFPWRRPGFELCDLLTRRGSPQLNVFALLRRNRSKDFRLFNAGEFR